MLQSPLLHLLRKSKLKSKWTNAMKKESINCLRMVEYFQKLEEAGMDLIELLYYAEIEQQTKNKRVDYHDSTILILEGKITIFRKKTPNEFNETALSLDIFQPHEGYQFLCDEGRGVNLNLFKNDPQVFDLCSNKLKVEFFKIIGLNAVWHFYDVEKVKEKMKKSVEIEKINMMRFVNMARQRKALIEKKMNSDRSEKVDKKKKEEKGKVKGNNAGGRKKIGMGSLIKARRAGIKFSGADKNKKSNFTLLTETKDERNKLSNIILSLTKDHVLISNTSLILVRWPKTIFEKFYRKKAEEELDKKVSSLDVFFPDMNKDILKRVLHSFEWRKLTRGTCVYKEGDLSNSYYLIWDGEVEILKHFPKFNKGETLMIKRDRGKEMKLAVYGNKQAFGRYEFLKGKKRSMKAKVSSSSATIIEVQKEIFQHLDRSSPFFREQFAEAATSQFKDMLSRIGRLRKTAEMAKLGEEEMKAESAKKKRKQANCFSRKSGEIDMKRNMKIDLALKSAVDESREPLKRIRSAIISKKMKLMSKMENEEALDGINLDFLKKNIEDIKDRQKKNKEKDFEFLEKTAPSFMKTFGRKTSKLLKSGLNELRDSKSCTAGSFMKFRRLNNFTLKTTMKTKSDWMSHKRVKSCQFAALMSHDSGDFDFKDGGRTTKISTKTKRRQTHQGRRENSVRFEISKFENRSKTSNKKTKSGYLHLDRTKNKRRPATSKRKPKSRQVSCLNSARKLASDQTSRKASALPMSELSNLNKDEPMMKVSVYLSKGRFEMKRRKGKSKSFGGNDALRNFKVFKGMKKRNSISKLLKYQREKKKIIQVFKHSRTNSAIIKTNQSFMRRSGFSNHINYLKIP